MVSNADIQKWQQAVGGIIAAQNELTPEELSAVSALVTLLNNGNFEASESGGYIQVIKNALPQHANNRLLQVHLKSFIALSEKYFRTRTAKPTGGATRQANMGGKAKSSGSGSMQKIIIVGITLVIGYFMVKDTEWFRNLFSGGRDKIKQSEEVVKNTDKNMQTVDKSSQTTNQSDVTTEEGVVINGVKWATRNVDKPGTFATKPEDAGMLFQWNRKIGWSTSDSIVNSNGDTVWDSSIPSGTAWEKDNDPSPDGWRVPSLDEIQKLLDINKVNIEWITENGVGGRKFTDKVTGNSIFVPATGDRNPNNGKRQFIGSVGDIWSNTQYDSNYAYNLYFDRGSYSGSVVLSNSERRFGFSVRCVAISQPQSTPPTTNSSPPGKFPQSSIKH